MKDEYYRFLKQVKPKVVLELGSFLGYSATRISGRLPEGIKWSRKRAVAGAFNSIQGYDAC